MHSSTQFMLPKSVLECNKHFYPRTIFQNETGTALRATPQMATATIIKNVTQHKEPSSDTQWNFDLNFVMMGFIMLDVKMLGYAECKNLQMPHSVWHSSVTNNRQGRTLFGQSYYLLHQTINFSSKSFIKHVPVFG